MIRSLLLLTVTIPWLLTCGTSAPPPSTTLVTVSRPYDTITDAAFPAGFPRFPLLFADSIAQASAAGALRRDADNAYIQIGRYATVNRRSELELEWGLNTLLPEAVAQLANYTLADAETEIARRARTARLLIITEAHTKPEHRVFTRCLLDELYAQGYRHLGLENITANYTFGEGVPHDSLLQARGYPILNVVSGEYAAEPEYGNLLRHAIQLGFQIFAYERNGSSDEERDIQQANNVIAYQQAHPGEKIICHGGWYHAIETRMEKWPGDSTYWFAYHYRRLTGDDPLTVYQDAMNEKVAASQPSSPYYTTLLDRLTPGGPPQVLVNATGELWRGPHGDMPFDVVTVTPPLGSTDQHRGWAGWSCDGRTYATVGLQRTVGQDWNSLSFPVRVEVRGLHDSPIATPLYASELRSGGEDRNIRLWAGAYRLDVGDRQGHWIKREVVVGKERTKQNPE